MCWCLAKTEGNMHNFLSKLLQHSSSIDHVRTCTPNFLWSRDFVDVVPRLVRTTSSIYSEQLYNPVSRTLAAAVHQPYRLHEVRRLAVRMYCEHTAWAEVFLSMALSAISGRKRLPQKSTPSTSYLRPTAFRLALCRMNVSQHNM